MGKYIIEVGDAYAEYVCGKGDMLCLPVRINEFEDNWLNTNIPLTPYTESDLDQVRKEAFEKGYSTAVAEQECAVRGAAEKAYQSGLNDAWAAAKNLQEIDMYTIHEIFGWVAGKREVFIRYTAPEAIEKLKTYEQEQETDGLRQNIQTIVDQCGYSLDEIATVLEKMRDGQDE